MHLPTEAQLLRIFIGESDKYHSKPLHEAILERAHDEGLAGGTVIHGMMGFGAHCRIHTDKILRLTEDLPVVVEIVDSPDKIASFVEILEGMIDEGLVTVEHVKVIAYRHEKSPA